jgi:hypothetical protein
MQILEGKLLERTLLDRFQELNGAAQNSQLALLDAVQLHWNWKSGFADTDQLIDCIAHGPKGYLLELASLCTEGSRYSPQLIQHFIPTKTSL